MTPSATSLRREAAALLGVAVDAPPAEVRRAFRAMVWSVHPDAREEWDTDDVRASALTNLCAARDLLLGLRQPMVAEALARPSRPPRLGEFLAVFGQSA